MFLSLSLTAGMDLAQSQLDLVIPSFEVQDSTLEQTVPTLLRWGIQVGLAVENGEDETRVARSFGYRDIPIREVLDIVTEEYSGCSSNAYRSEGIPLGIVVNMDCIADDRNDLFEIHVDVGRNISALNPPVYQSPSDASNKIRLSV